MPQPDPLPETLPEGTTALNGALALVGGVGSLRRAGPVCWYYGPWVSRVGAVPDATLLMSPREIDWPEEDLAASNVRGPMKDSPFLSIPEAVALGFARSRIAYSERCVSCPCCDTLLSAVRPGEGCYDCGWKPGEPVDRERPSSHNGKKTMENSDYIERVNERLLGILAGLK